MTDWPRKITSHQWPDDAWPGITNVNLLMQPMQRTKASSCCTETQDKCHSMKQKETKCANSREPVVWWSCPHRCLFRASAPTLAGKWSSPCLLAQCVTALSRIWFSLMVSTTGPGCFYSGEAGSPPGLCDLRRASSLTNKRCVGLREKPPHRCQNKSPHRPDTLNTGRKIYNFELTGLMNNRLKRLNVLTMKIITF